MKVRTPDELLSPDYAKKNPARAFARGLCPVYPECAPEPPEHLNEFAKQTWHECYALLSAQKVVSAADRNALASYCEIVADAKKLHDQCEEEGFVVQGDRGLSAHPAASLLNRYRTTMLSYGQQFGFTPVSRPKASKRPDESEKAGNEFSED